eukprot:4960649-Pyramimonas_sp.AAC.1
MLQQFLSKETNCSMFVKGPVCCLDVQRKTLQNSIFALRMMECVLPSLLGSLFCWFPRELWQDFAAGMGGQRSSSNNVYSSAAFNFVRVDKVNAYGKSIEALYVT